MRNITDILARYLSDINLPSVSIIDIIEIILITFFVYQFMVWIKFTRAYTLLKGLLVIGAFLIIAYIFKMNTILWIVSKLASALITAIVVIFQPELRKVVEQLGQKKIMASIFPFDSGKEVKERFTDKTVNELIKACFDMAEVKTGALIVIEQEIRLDEYVRTGINVDALLTSQLMINIFEHNTPLHDGAVIVRENRIVAATCYLPLSDNMELSKQLGTRHRAGVGISEVTDSVTIIVSEEKFGKEGAFITKCTSQLMRDLGCAQSPQSAFILNLGLESLHVRMPRHVENGQAVAEFLEKHDKVEFVNYPTLPSNKYYETAKKYLPNGGCGVVSFELKGGRAAAEKFMKNLKLAAIETHVADARTCCLNPATSTHRQMNDEQLAAAGIPAGLIRISCGLEDKNDLIADIAQALDAI